MPLALLMLNLRYVVMEGFEPPCDIKNLLLPKQASSTRLDYITICYNISKKLTYTFVLVQAPNEKTLVGQGQGLSFNNFLRVNLEYYTTQQVLQAFVCLADTVSLYMSLLLSFFFLFVLLILFYLQRIQELHLGPWVMSPMRYYFSNSQYVIYKYVVF